MDTTTTNSSGEAIASRYIRPIDELQVGDLAILCIRVSGRVQNAAGNLDDQQQHLERVAKERGAKVVGVIPQVGSGWKYDWLLEAIAMAKRLGAKLLAESVSRFIRSPSYHSVDAPNALPSEEQMARLASICDGVILVTVLHPDATPEEERGFQTIRGQKAKGRRGGRPAHKGPGYKKAQRLKNQPQVLGLRNAGHSLGEISKKTGVPKSTIQRWLG